VRKSEKAEIVGELTTAMRENAAVILSDYRGLTVKEMSELRRRLAALGVNVRVVKNTLLRRALSEDQQGLADYLKGPMAATFVPGDFGPALREMTTFAKTHKQLAFKGGWIEARAFDGTQMTALADIPPREQLLGMLVSMLNAPLSQLVGTLQAVPRDLVLTLMSLAEKRGGGGEAEAAAAPGA
jgi:large subunit ribosomal protein L10